MHHYAYTATAITGMLSLSESQNQIKVIPPRLNKQQPSCIHMQLCVVQHTVAFHLCVVNMHITDAYYNTRLS